MAKSTSVNLFDLLIDILNFFWRAFIVAYSYVWIMTISLYMHHRGHLKDTNHDICNMTLGTFFKTFHFHSYFANEIFVPLFAAVCTNSYKSMLNYPASDVLGK
jgi:predicted NAD/FAD-binding protein